MPLYSCLKKVPLPETIYNGPLDERIVPLVKAVNAHFLTTLGSCEGHLKRSTPYPWVQFSPYEEHRLLDYLVDAYSRRHSSSRWYRDGNSLRTRQTARTQRQLIVLQNSIGELAEFLFQYRPEALDPDYRGYVRMPDTQDPQYQRISRRIDNLYEELLELNRRLKSDDPKRIKILGTKTTMLQKLLRQEQEIGDILVLPVTEKQMAKWLQKVKEILG